MRDAKQRAASVQQPSDLWDLEEYLGRRRREIDNKFDYRYSILPLVFANLLHDGLITLDDLRGIGEDKLAFVCHAAELR